jgi:arginyl-tRNA synthetase
MTIAETIQQSIQKALESLNIPDVSFVVEHPSDLSHGDYATNVALAASKSTQKNPREVAEMIVNEIKKQAIPEISDITIAGPGFINFTLATEFFNQSVLEILNHEKDFGNVSVHADKKILVEHSSPNLFKPFHIGHMMNNAIGESLVRLMQSSGADVATMSFPSDISLGIAKAIFVILEKYVKDDQIFNPGNIVILGDAYVEGTKRYDEDESIHGRVKEIADNLYGNISSPELDVFNTCKNFNIEYFEHIVGKLGSHFDSYIYESESGEVGKKIVLENTPVIFTESEGAIVYIPDESKKNLNTSVFVNSQGNPTYDAKDLGLLSMKFEKHHPDLSVFVTDHEQIPHFNIVLDAAEKINSEWKEKSIHVPHGRMSFKGQKMSSRLGGVPLAAEMIDVVSEEVAEVSAGRDIDQKTKSDIAIAAIKFSILRAKPGMNINFDPETSLSFEGDSGPYLQYTHARIQTLIEKAKEQGITAELQSGIEISDLEKIMYRFPEVVELAITEYAPNYVVTYLLEIARSFNSFYGSNKIIDTDNKEISAHRIAIARSAQIIIKNGLWMLGINAPDRM